MEESGSSVIEGIFRVDPVTCKAAAETVGAVVHRLHGAGDQHPVIFLPSLKMTAAMAHPEGMRTWPSFFMRIHSFQKVKRVGQILMNWPNIMQEPGG